MTNGKYNSVFLKDYQSYQFEELSLDYQPGIVLSCTFFHMSWKGKITGIKAAVGMLNLSDHWKVVLCSLSLVLFFFFPV